MTPNDRRAQALLAAIVESSDDAIVSKTLNGIVTSWNGGAERLFGYTAQEAIGRSITLIIPPDRLAEERMILGRLRNGERIEHYETMRRSKDGRLVEVSLTVSPVFDADGSIIGASKVARDITQRRRIEAALRESDRHKDEFLTILSHELRNPLAPIMSAAQLLLQPSCTLQQSRWAAQLIDRQTQHMARLVDDLMDVARINTGKVQLQPRTQPLTAIIAAAVDSNRASIEEMGHRLEVRVPEAPVWLHVDGDRLQQVLANLVSNAAKFTEPGGLVRLDAGVEQGQAVIRVCDTGIGIAPDKLEGIFELYLQAEQGLARTRGGLGIGLTVARKLVELHGGSLSARSAGEGMGAEFTVRLPLSATAELPPTIDTGATTPAAHRVLVVDDNEDAALALALLLTEAGHVVEVAHDGAEALRRCACFAPDTVLLDLGLPGMSGYQVAAQLRERHGRTPRLIALTGWGQEKDRIATRNAGFDHHLTKPVSFQTIAALLEKPGSVDPESPLRRANGG